jgi:hypothetical protein
MKEVRGSREKKESLKQRRSKAHPSRLHRLDSFVEPSPSSRGHAPPIRLVRHLDCAPVRVKFPNVPVLRQSKDVRPPRLQLHNFAHLRTLWKDLRAKDPSRIAERRFIAREVTAIEGTPADDLACRGESVEAPASSDERNGRRRELEASRDRNPALDEPRTERGGETKTAGGKAETAVVVLLFDSWASLSVLAG